MVQHLLRGVAPAARLRIRTNVPLPLSEATTENRDEAIGCHKKDGALSDLRRGLGQMYMSSLECKALAGRGFGTAQQLARPTSARMLHHHLTATPGALSQVISVLSFQVCSS